MATRFRGDAVFRSVRWRLTAWNVFILSIILLLLGTLFYLTMRISLIRHEEDDLFRAAEHIAQGFLRVTREESQARRLRENQGEREAEEHDDEYRLSERRYRRELEERGLDPEEPLTITLVWTYLEAKNGFKWRSTQPGLSFFPYERDVKTVWRTGRPLLSTVSQAGETVRVLTTPVRLNGNLIAVVQAGKPITGVETTLHRLLMILILTGFGGVALATIGGLFLAGRALIPIRMAFKRQLEFVADASHELRTPLSIIRTSAEMLDKELKDSEAADNPMVRELMDNLLSESERMGHLVSDLLTLARADSSEELLDIKRIDIAALMQGVARKFSVLAQQKGINLSAETPPRLEIDADPARLEQLLAILCDNAIKYTNPGGQVRVSLSTAGNKARIAISDTGVGIPPEHLPRIFDRFYRVDKARSREQGGTGLGLAIAKWIAEAHGGSIEAASTPGKGTTFTVSLPMNKTS